MAHFAQLDDNNIVSQVIVINDNDCQINGFQSEDVGIAFCKSLFGENTKWVQTSYNKKIRKNYAGIGFTYDVQRDAFIPPQPYPSWILNPDTFQWESPVPYPQNGTCAWDEATLSWKDIPITIDIPLENSTGQT